MKYILLIGFVIYVSLATAQKTDSLAPYVYRWSNLEAIKEDTRIRRQILEGSTTSLSYFEVHASTLESGKAPHPPHKHDDQEELMIVLEGTVKITINGISKILGSGSIAFAMPGDEHGIENAGTTQATYYILKYKGRFPNHERGKQAGGSFMLDWNDLQTRNTGKGYRRDFFNRATSQLAQFEMHTTALNADSASHAPHTHVQEEIILILRGNVTMHIDGKLFPASYGDVVFLPSRIPHALLNTGKEQCEYFAFQWRN
ncbi:MAG: cupin domain-containing protein [Chitinophagaceae bacterium]|nr:cupin domain-containing protein [Chitinophagaceae bacterium]